jgi:dihydrofolate reductase
MHISLDGFVGGKNGEMDWIHVDDEIFEYAGKMTDEADTALYGRTTYEMMAEYWPTAGEQPNASKHDKQHSQWYNSVQKVVLSKSMKGKNIPGTTIVSENISEEITKLKKMTGKNIQVFGSPSAIHALMRDNLIDEYWLFVNPLILGGGIPMFTEVKDRQKLQLMETHTFSSGVVGLHYVK